MSLVSAFSLCGVEGGAANSTPHLVQLWSLWVVLYVSNGCVCVTLDREDPLHHPTFVNGHVHVDAVSTRAGILCLSCCFDHKLILIQFYSRPLCRSFRRTIQHMANLILRPWIYTFARRSMPLSIGAYIAACVNIRVYLLVTVCIRNELLDCFEWMCTD